ncbi:MAG: ABC transporter permease [Chloroflexi bacterium]|nr:MAG: ABC transporter permease [Chloroflexota bacterium]
MDFSLTKKLSRKRPQTKAILALRWRKAWRDLWMHKSRTLLVVLSIAIGIFAFGLIAGAQYTLITEFPISHQKINPASGIIHAALFDEAMVDAVRRMPEVAVAEGRFNTTVRYLDGDGEWHDLELFALEDYAVSEVNLIRPFSGTYPPPENQFLIERNSINLTGHSVGDAILIETSTGLQRTVPIAGLTHDLNQAPAQVTGIPYAYVTRDTLEWFGMSRNFNELHFIVAEQPNNKAHIQQVAQEITEKVERNGRFVFWTEVPDPGEHFVQDFLPAILIILSILGGLALILSGFLVINVIMAILAQQRRQVGIMKTIGARTHQITTLYLRMIFIFGLAGLVLAIPLGAVAASEFSQFIATQLNFDIERFQLAPAVLILEIVVGLATPVLVSLIPIVSSTRVTVREAIQDFGLKGSRDDPSKMAQLVLAIQDRMRLPRPLRLSLRNTFRRKGRLVRTLITLMLGGAIFMSVLTLRHSLFNTLETTLASQGYDVLLQLDRPYREPQMSESLAGVDGIVAIEYWIAQPSIPLRDDETEGDSTVMYGLPADTELFVPDMVNGRWLTPEDTNAIVLPVSMTESEPDAALGSTITMRVGREESDWQIVGFYQYFQPPIAPPIVYANHPYVAKTLGHYDQSNSVRIITDQHDAETHLQIASAADAALKRVDIEITSARTATEDRELFSERFYILTSILLLLSFLLALVGSLGLMGTMSINVLERRREIGVMRAIGASNWSVLQIFVVEGVIIGLISWVGAIILSQPMSRIMSKNVGMAFVKQPLNYQYNVQGIFLWLAMVVVISALASLLPAYRAASLSVRETISYE